MTDFKWIWLDIDVPIARDFIGYEERISGNAMTRAEMSSYLCNEFRYGASRANVIIDTIKGEDFR